MQQQPRYDTIGLLINDPDRGSLSRLRPFVIVQPFIATLTAHIHKIQCHTFRILFRLKEHCFIVSTLGTFYMG